MRRVQRAIGNLLTAISLLLAIGITLIWAGQFSPLIGWPDEPVSRPHLTVTTNEYQSSLGIGVILPQTAPLPGLGGRRFGFGYWDCKAISGDNEIGTYRGVEIPYWAVIVASLLLPVRHYMMARKARRLLQEGHCRNCGYDLRATPDRCPECGTIP